MFTQLRTFVVVASCAGALACGGGSSSSTTTNKSSSNPSPPPASGTVGVFPTKVFVGVDESGPLSPAPVSVTGASGTTTWSSSDAAVAVTGNAISASISAVKIGAATVTVKAGDGSANVSVTVQKYAASAVTSGKAEFTSAGCAGCHDGDGPDVTPSGIGKHSDDEILGAFQEGKNPEGGDVDSPNHEFAVSAAVVAYLRSLPARTPTPKQDD